jgi:hypothetical protein
VCVPSRRVLVGDRITVVTSLYPTWTVRQATPEMSSLFFLPTDLHPDAVQKISWPLFQAVVR